MRKQPIVFVLLPLLVGFFIYFSCRTNRLLYYDWIPYKATLRLDAVHVVANLKCKEAMGRGQLPDLFVFSLPGSLFAFSVTYYVNRRYLVSLLKGLPWVYRLAWRSCFVVVLAAVPEVLQSAGLLPGRYDSLDIFAAAFASSAAFVFADSLTKRGQPS